MGFCAVSCFISRGNLDELEPDENLHVRSPKVFSQRSGRPNFHVSELNPEMSKKGPKKSEMVTYEF